MANHLFTDKIKFSVLGIMSIALEKKVSGMAVNFLSLVSIHAPSIVMVAQRVVSSLKR